MSIQLALAKTLANAIKNYHYQTKISKLNVANNKPQFNHTFTMLYRKLLKYRLFDPKEFYIKRVGFFDSTLQSYGITTMRFVSCNADAGPTLL